MFSVFLSQKRFASMSQFRRHRDRLPELSRCSGSRTVAIAALLFLILCAQGSVWQERKKALVFPSRRHALVSFESSHSLPLLLCHGIGIRFVSQRENTRMPIGWLNYFLQTNYLSVLPCWNQVNSWNFLNWFTSST